MKICALDFESRGKPEDIPLLNHYTKSSIDFSKVKWHAMISGDAWRIRGELDTIDGGTIRADDYISTHTWPYLTESTRRVVFQASILTVAAKLAALYPKEQ